MGIIIFFEKKLAILSNVMYNAFVVHGWIPEWPKGADCKSVGTAFEGSNPSPPTKPYHWLSRCGSIGRAADL